LQDFTSLNGRFGDIRSATKRSLLQTRGHAALAIAATAKGGFVPL
jgi:hypothetical protein